VTRIPWEADRQTHELLVEVTPRRLERRIAIGQRADVRSSWRRATTRSRVPTRWLHHDAAGPFVYVDRGGRIAVVRPTLGLTGRDHVEVLAGLAEGDACSRRRRRARPSRVAGAGWAMNLALRDVRRHLARFVGTAGGLGPAAERRRRDAGHLRRHGRRRDDLDPRDARRPVGRAARHPRPLRRGVRASTPAWRPRGGGARRAHAPGRTPISSSSASTAARVMRIALVGLGWPDDPGRSCRWCAGGPAQPHGELIVDASLGLAIGESLVLAGEPYRVVGLTQERPHLGWRLGRLRVVADAQLIAFDQPAEATCSSGSAW
jgi:hypothetical protein